MLDQPRYLTLCMRYLLLIRMHWIEAIQGLQSRMTLPDMLDLHLIVLVEQFQRRVEVDKRPHILLIPQQFQ